VRACVRAGMPRVEEVAKLVFIIETLKMEGNTDGNIGASGSCVIYPRGPRSPVQ